MGSYPTVHRAHIGLRREREHNPVPRDTPHPYGRQDRPWMVRFQLRRVIAQTKTAVNRPHTVGARGNLEGKGRVTAATLPRLKMYQPCLRRFIGRIKHKTESHETVIVLGRHPNPSERDQRPIGTMITAMAAHAASPPRAGQALPRATGSATPPVLSPVRFGLRGWRGAIIRGRAMNAGFDGRRPPQALPSGTRRVPTRRVAWSNLRPG